MFSENDFQNIADVLQALRQVDSVLEARLTRLTEISAAQQILTKAVAKSPQDSHQEQLYLRLYQAYQTEFIEIQQAMYLVDFGSTPIPQ